MANPGRAFPLSLPARTSAKLATLYADTLKDLTGGDWAATMAAFDIDQHNINNNTNTGDLRQIAVSTPGAGDKPMAFTIISDGHAQI